MPVCVCTVTKNNLPYIYRKYRDSNSCCILRGVVGGLLADLQHRLLGNQCNNEATVGEMGGKKGQNS